MKSLAQESDICLWKLKQKDTQRTSANESRFNGAESAMTGTASFPEFMAAIPSMRIIFYATGQCSLILSTVHLAHLCFRALNSMNPCRLGPWACFQNRAVVSNQYQEWAVIWWTIGLQLGPQLLNTFSWGWPDPGACWSPWWNVLSKLSTFFHTRT